MNLPAVPHMSITVLSDGCVVASESAAGSVSVVVRAWQRSPKTIHGFLRALVAKAPASVLLERLRGSPSIARGPAAVGVECSVKQEGERFRRLWAHAVKDGSVMCVKVARNEAKLTLAMDLRRALDAPLSGNVYFAVRAVGVDFSPLEVVGSSGDVAAMFHLVGLRPATFVIWGTDIAPAQQAVLYGDHWSFEFVTRVRLTSGSALSGPESA